LLGGVLAGMLIDDSYERLLLERMGQLPTTSEIAGEPHQAQESI
jgi:hypothetical protein